MISHVVPEVIGNAKKLLKVALIRRYGYIIYAVFLILRELNPIVGKFMTYEFHLGIAKVDFVGVEGYFVFSKTIEYKSQVFKQLLLRLSVYKDIVYLRFEYRVR